MDGRTDSPCVLQDFVPFGAAALLPLNLNHILLKQGTGTAVHLLPLGCYSCFTGCRLHCVVGGRHSQEVGIVQSGETRPQFHDGYPIYQKGNYDGYD